MYALLLFQLLALLTTGCGTNYDERDESPHPKNSLQLVGELKTGRAAHAAVLLENGKVLVTGGFGQDQKALDSAELFDPGSKTFAQASDMNTARSGHTATLLHDGRVLIAGGFNVSYLDSAEIYDPETAQFKPTSRMTVARNGHTATVLDDGRVLLVGGTSTGWSFLADAEIFDPKTDTFYKTGNMTAARVKFIVFSPYFHSPSHADNAGFALASMNRKLSVLTQPTVADPLTGVYQTQEKLPRDLETST
ncbi:Kelch repeat-containing protein [Leptolyngbya sp. 7M]|uniref:Kelch repeat-containing protein n=1 Tax=Leptolyngbya sp. 7M TaxID=2812896 RepID=UPI001B8CA8BC|nr:kelch repeat-containing protein [Leptolyngbya sp. 7M]QYO67720.1 hypothetical protein JVX88_13570 [Leptolyngbya sp. 7M]